MRVDRGFNFDVRNRRRQPGFSRSSQNKKVETKTKRETASDNTRPESSHDRAEHPRTSHRERAITFSGNKGSSRCLIGATVLNATQLNWRVKTVRYPCPNPNCRSVFAWKRNLMSHLRYQCGQKPRFQCPYCEYMCKVKADVRKHIKVKHQGYDVLVIDNFQRKIG